MIIVVELSRQMSLVSGLSREANAIGKLEGVKWDKEHEGLYWFGPLR